jgi:hypothetical protein
VCPALFGMLATGDLTAVATDWLPIDRSPAAAAAAAGGEREIRMGGLHPCLRTVFLPAA